MSGEDDFFEWFRRRRWPLFGLPFRGMFGDMDEFFREFSRFYEEAFKDIEKRVPRDLVRERRLPDGRISREMGPFVYGYSLTIGPDGKPVIREFGNVRPSLRGRRPVEVVEKREPLVDVIDENGTIKIVAEVPGVTKEDIQLQLTERSLTISVEAERKYYKVVDLPAEVRTDSAKASYKNGILEVSVTKSGPAKPEGKPVKIE